jgi:hypothetical protein
MRELAPGRRLVVDDAVYAKTPRWDDSGSSCGRSKRGCVADAPPTARQRDLFHCQLLVTHFSQADRGFAAVAIYDSTDDCLAKPGQFAGLTP